MGFLSLFLSFAAAQAEAHPDVLRVLINGIASSIAAHEQHPQPASTAAILELRAGLAAAASSAVTSLIAKQGLRSAVPPAPTPAAQLDVPRNPTMAPAPEPAADAPRMA